MPHTIDSPCSRCGTCCRRGGPALHLPDRGLVAEGVIQTRDLFTIRRGETARDPVQGGLVRATGDIIKVKGCGGAWTCRFFDGDAGACRVYDRRPLECRALDCRDPGQLAAIYAQQRLSRADLLSEVEGLWEVIRDHDRRCDCERARELLADPRPAAGHELAEMQRFDQELRRLMVARGGLEAEMLDFLLGRALSVVIRLLQREAAPAPPAAPREGSE